MQVRRFSNPALQIAFIALLAACGGAPEPVEITRKTLAPALVQEKAQRQQQAQKENGVAASSQILFGDLHVHTTYSPDAFITAMPLMQGSGLAPPAAACDFARFCSALDFWSINDHAEGITPERWELTREAIRQCNAVAGDSDNPDTVAFLGWEWSQVNNMDRNQHYGHKNVIFLDTANDKVPARSIAAPRKQLNKSPIGVGAQYVLAAMDWKNRNLYLSIDDYYQAIADTPICEKGVNTRDLPNNCLEVADKPAELFEKLKQWGFDSIVIPHGNAWGMNTPGATTFDKQLNRRQHAPALQTLFEVYSGHGNSEEYRDWRAVEYDADGVGSCPEVSANYQPCCRRAGELIFERCSAGGASEEECRLRESVAQKNYIDAGVSGHLTVPGARTEDWLNCGQCEDCFNPPMDHRPGTTAQYALAITNFDDPQQPLRFEFGFIASSDNHRGRGGTGYKEFARHAMTEANGPRNKRLGAASASDQREPIAHSVTLAESGDVNLNRLRNMERQGSFFMTGGLVAVHSEGRRREQIWQSLKQRQVYGTSGDRILLWFDLLDGEQTIPMGSTVSRSQNPRFRVTAAGAFNQEPGCPQSVIETLTPQRVDSLCRGECYNPGDQRKSITRIEVVRIRPQQSPGEDVGELIEDPWRVFDCKADANGCTVEFEDKLFSGGEREVRYYVRAIQQPSDAVNAGGLRCEYDEQGQCIAVNPCYGDYRTDSGDDCLWPNEERAWSSPIYVRWQAASGQDQGKEKSL